jgi:arabinose-5-phosphate isomerase
MAADILTTAIQAIRSEAQSVEALAAFIDNNFEKTVIAIHQSKGRIIISGIGKSAIVAQKIVATFNSTGTPALFMHAADAIHGDLGMIQPADMVMILSNSGSSPEIKALVPLIKSLGNKLIGMVGNMQSYLAMHADFIVNASVTAEACPNNLAPTNSTTAQMVMGDVLAVCLMELKEFTEKDFARYHPGGNIGKRLYLRVEDMYKINPSPCVQLQTPVKEVITEISRNRLGCTAVLDEANNLIGIITDGDVRRMLEQHDNISQLQAKDIYSRNPKTILSQALAVEALNLMKRYDITQLIVIDNSEYAGVLHLHDLLREGII